MVAFSGVLCASLLRIEIGGLRLLYKIKKNTTVIYFTNCVLWPFFKELSDHCVFELKKQGTNKNCNHEKGNTANSINL
jgi:hypothetical protein